MHKVYKRLKSCVTILVVFQILYTHKNEKTRYQVKCSVVVVSVVKLEYIFSTFYHFFRLLPFFPPFALFPLFRLLPFFPLFRLLPFFPLFRLLSFFFFRFSAFYPFFRFSVFVFPFPFFRFRVLPLPLTDIVKFAILKLEKGNGIVLTNRQDYATSVKSLFSGSNKFSKLNTDPTLTVGFILYSITY